MKKKFLMLIKQLKIEKFKKFDSLTINFDTLDCLVGGNNSGKSTILQALALFDFCLHQCLSKINGKAITLKNRSITEEDFVVLPVTKGTDLWHDRIWQAKNKHILIAITVIFDNDKEVKTTLDFNFNRFSLVTKTDPDEQWLTELQAFKISYLPVFSTFQTKEEKRTQIAVRSELNRGNVNVVIRNLLLSLKEEKREQELADLLQRSFPSIKKMRIEFDESAQQFIEVSYLEDDKRKEFDIFSAGSGFQQFIYLFGFILLEEPNIILLDEPDVHLHGQLQKNLFEELQRLIRERNKQVIFATHSRDLITNVPPENIIHVSHQSAKRLSKDFEVFNVLDTLGSLENTQLIVLQEFRRVLIVENSTDWDTLQTFGRLVLGEIQMQEIAKRLTVIYAHGNPVKQEIHKLRKQLQDSFTDKTKDVRVFVVADSDYFPQTDELIDDLRKKERGFNNSTTNYIDWHIWERTELENYWVIPSVLLRLLKPKTNAQMTIGEDVFQATFAKLVEEQKDKIEGRLLKGYEEYSKHFKKGWDSTTCLEKAKERLKIIWENSLHYADAKLLRKNIASWLQESNYESFSDKKIMSLILKEDLPKEMSIFFENLAHFAGVKKN